jgi:hypothetical protein
MIGFNLGADPRQSRPKLRIAVITPSQPPSQLDPHSRSGQMVVEVDGEQLSHGIAATRRQAYESGREPLSEDEAVWYPLTGNDGPEAPAALERCGRGKAPFAYCALRLPFSLLQHGVDLPNRAPVKTRPEKDEKEEEDRARGAVGGDRRDGR